MEHTNKASMQFVGRCTYNSNTKEAVWENYEILYNKKNKK